MKNIYLEKSIFVDAFSEVYALTDSGFGVTLKYHVDEASGEEYVYAYYEGRRAHKRVCVTADSYEAIIKDVLNNLDHAVWITGADARYLPFEDIRPTWSDFGNR